MTELASLAAPDGDELLDDGTRDLAHIKRSSMRGAAINFGSQAIRFAVQFLYQIAIMRLLTPDDFGLVAMAAPVLGFVQLFTDLGLTQATVQLRQITQRQLSFLFWFGAAVSGALSVLTIAAAPLAGWFYHKAQVVPIIQVLGALIFLGGLSSQPSAILARRMEYGKIVAVGMAGQFLGIGVGIVTALAGYGYWALVFNQVAATVATLVLTWIAARWLPLRPGGAHEIRKLIHNGGNLTVSNILSYFSQNTDNILIGKFCGDVALGIYDRAYRLLVLPLRQFIWPLSSVAVPTLVRLVHEPELYRRAFSRMLGAIVLLTYPGIVFAMCDSRQLILTVVGARWLEVAPIFSVLALSGLLSIVNNAGGWLYLSQDRSRDYRNWGMISSAIVITSFVIGLPWKALGVATSYSTVMLVHSPLSWWWATRRGPVSLRDVLSSLAPHALAAASCLIAMLILPRYLPTGYLSLAILAVLSYAMYGGVFAAHPKGRFLLRSLKAQIELALGRGGR